MTQEDILSVLNFQSRLYRTELFHYVQANDSQASWHFSHLSCTCSPIWLPHALLNKAYSFFYFTVDPNTTGQITKAQCCWHWALKHLSAVYRDSENFAVGAEPLPPYTRLHSAHIPVVLTEETNSVLPTRMLQWRETRDMQGSSSEGTWERFLRPDTLEKQDDRQMIVQRVNMHKKSWFLKLLYCVSPVFHNYKSILSA